MKFLNLSKSAIIFIAAIILLEAVNIGLIFYLSQPRSNSEKNSQNIVTETPAADGTNSVPQPIASGQASGTDQKSGQTKQQPVSAAGLAVQDNPVIPPEAPLPPDVFNTQGTIISLQADGITTEGNGSNFGDQKTRQIKVKFNEETVVSEKDGTKYAGLAGLKHLSTGDKVLIESAQNIRSKTEFTAKFISKQ